uniref:Transient-receptor-potential-like protein n=2 Tax=Cacopsylla melanoneura TaxID=428564 RepID=A0A8D8XPQ3_9HEMI
MDEKVHFGGVGVEIEGPGIVHNQPFDMPNLPKPLTLEEKKYLLSVERGDTATVRKYIKRAYRNQHIDINCADPLGRSALTLAIEGENLEMTELLIVMGVEPKDALLQAINSEFVEAVELLLEYEEIVHKDGEPYSWEKVDKNTSMFTKDITPLILAAHKNNYEILKILLDRGATLPMPHDVRCGCDVCLRETEEDSLRHSMSRVNEYRALASPSLIALSSNDPILTAFQLSWELRNLAFTEPECRNEYMELRKQCQQFAVDLLQQSRSTQELLTVLNHDPESPYEEGEPMKLTRLELAIDYKQKRFVAHSNIQQLLAAMWYDGLPGFRRKPLLEKMIDLSKIILIFPYYCFLYMISGTSDSGKIIRKPFVKFVVHASSYLSFLFVLLLVSQRADVILLEKLGWTDTHLTGQQRGLAPSLLEYLVLIYVAGYIWEETCEVWKDGLYRYLKDMWNFIDFTRNLLYVLVFMLRAMAYYQQTAEIEDNPTMKMLGKEHWNAFDPQLIAEGLFAGANVFSALKLVHLFSINPHLGPLQISLGRMIIDIVKFFFIYTLVLFAFACGLNQLLWYFTDLERKDCYSTTSGEGMVFPSEEPNWVEHDSSCAKWRSFNNLFESSQSLFWASFGSTGTDAFELKGIKSYTRFWGLLMFGSYSVINVIVLLNLLIAMMSNSYAMIEEHSDTEWKFARTKLWLSYFDDSPTLPPPFNIFPTTKMFLKLFGLRKIDKMRKDSLKRKQRQEKERDYRYAAVMRALVWRYICLQHRQGDSNPVTEDDVNEIKGEITSMRYELMNVLDKNGMDTSSADKKEKTVIGKKNQVWERRLMKNFQLTPVVTAEDEVELVRNVESVENEDPLDRFRRVAKLAVLNSSALRWGQIIRSVCKESQIGRCNNRESFKKQQNLERAMREAKRKLMNASPDRSNEIRNVSPMPVTEQSSLVKLIGEFTDEMKKESDNERYLTVKSAKSMRPTPRELDEGRIPSINVSQATPVSTLRKPSPPPAPLKPQQDCGPRIFKKKAPSPTGVMQLTARDLLAKQIDSREDSNQGPAVYELGENRNNDVIPSSSSQDYLLDTRSGEDMNAPLRPIKKIDDVKTIKRQPSDGWM